MSSGKSPMKATRSGRRAKRGSSQRTSRHMLCEMLEQRQLLAADLVLSANDGPLSNQSDDGTTDVFSIAPQVTANTLDVFINGQSALSGDSSAIGTLALNGSSDADSLTVDLSGAATTTLDIIPTASGATASWDFGGSTAVELTDFETIDATSGLFDLRIRQDLSLDYAADGLEDRIELELTDGGTRLLIRVNGVDQAKVGGAGSINVIGSSDIDTYVVNETSSGLPSAPIHVGDNANVPGVDNLEVNMATAHTVDYNSTTTGVPKSGVVSINGATDISYEGLAPVMINSAGGTLNVNAIDNPAITMLTIADDLLDTMGPGTNLITADGGFETLFFINASTLNVYGGAGSETITFAGTDPADITLTMVNLFGADFFDTDAGDDTIVVETLNPEITVNADGGDGGDTITIAGAPNSLDAISSTAAINVTGGGGTDLLQVLDGADTDNNAYTVNPTAVTRTSAGPAVSIGYAVDVETVEVEAGTGEDTFQVTPSTATEYDLDGNDPTNPSGVAPGDTLTVDISGFPGAAIAIGVTTGTISGGGMADIDFTNFEFVMTPPPVFFFPDAFEPNDSIDTATVLGSVPKITLNDVLLHDVNDIDVFKITAMSTGKQIINAFFDTNGGNVDIEVQDMGGNTIANGAAIAGGEGIVIPVVNQEMYFLLVTLADDPDVLFDEGNLYDLELENFTAPTPDKPLLSLVSDTGMMNDDNVTNVNTPNYFITADLADFDNMGIPIDAGVGVPGAEVILAFTNTVTGVQTTVEADRVGANSSFWSATPAALNDDVYLVQAWVRIEDGQNDPDAEVGRSLLSEPMLLTVDTAPPNVDVPDLLVSSDTGMDIADHVTNKMSPAFSGTAEPGAKVRILANGAIVGQSVATTDGRWEITVEPLRDGTYTITAEAEDSAGNMTTTVAMNPDLIVDSTEPNTPYLDLLNDRGHDPFDNITSAGLLNFLLIGDDTVDGNGNPFPNEIKYRLYWRAGDGLGEVLVYDSFAALGGFTANGQLNVIVSQNLNNPAGTPFPDGFHNFKLEVEDRAGNISHDFLLDVLIDTQAFLGDGDLHPEADSGVWGFAATMADRITSAKVPSFFGVAEADNIVTLTVDGNLLGGTTVAVPLDGDDAFQPPNAPNNEVEGNWRIDSNLNLTDGEHSAVFTFEDPAGNRLSTAPLLFMVDTQGPRVTDVDINNLGNAFNIFDHKYEGDGTLAPTPLVNSLVVSVSDLPNRTANFLYDAVFEATAENPGHYQIRGDANGIIPIQSVQFDRVNLVAGQPATGTITLIFAAPLPDDRFTLSISDDISDVAGNALDGESNASEPHDAPGFPSGDGQHGGDFVARFTVDSRAEIGSWGTGSVYIDTNGNFTFDPENQDFTNEDISYVLGFPSDDIFAGNFVQAANGMADGFDKLAAYGDAGLPPNASNFRWLIDTDNDGVPNINVSDPANINGLPVAGNFDFNAANGDEVGVFTGQSWWFDTTHNFQVNQSLNTQQRGLPIIGDFDGDGFDDLGTYDESLNRFEFDLTGGVQNSWDGIVDQVFTFNFIGIRERPVAADFDGDGHDDIGLWVPDRAGATPGESAEWYILVSGNNPITNRLAGAVAGMNPVFTPEPFQADLFAQFGDDFGLPVVGNFDPPVAPAANEVETMDYDVNGDGQITGFDALMVINLLDGSEALDGYNYDINGDNQVTPFDALMVINALEDDAPVAAMSSAAVVRADASESVADQSIAPPSTMEEVAAVGLSDQAISGVVAEVTSTPVSQPVGTAVDFADLAHGLLAVDDSDSPQDAVDEIAADITAAWMEE